MPSRRTCSRSSHAGRDAGDPLRVGRPRGVGQSELVRHVRRSAPRFLRQRREPADPGRRRAYNQTDSGQTEDGGAALDYSAVWLYNTDALLLLEGAGGRRCRGCSGRTPRTPRSRPPGCRRSTGSLRRLPITFKSRAPSGRPRISTGRSTTRAGRISGKDDPRGERANLCADTYGYQVGGTFDASTLSLQRDFPIIEAHDDQLLIGRFGYTGTGGNAVPREPGHSDWSIVGPDPSNVPFLKLMQCCFNDQIQFNVRTGGQWSAVGSANGFLHHIVATGSDIRCAPSCEARDALLNGRAAPIPVALVRTQHCPPPSPSRATACSPCAIRCSRSSSGTGRDPTQTAWRRRRTNLADPARDMAWTFSTRGAVLAALREHRRVDDRT